jgi:hypothetical protein
MAKSDNPNNNDIRRFDGNLTDDVSDYHLRENQWRYMRNGTTQFGSNNATNEPGNKHCITATYPIIGYIYLYDDKWIIFSANLEGGSEIGLFEEMYCKYTIKITEDGVTAKELNFHPHNLITGESKQNFDCSWNIYWSDGHRNPDRTLNIDDIPWKGSYTIDANGCRIFIPIVGKVDGEKLKLNRNVNIPCMRLTRGASGGNLLNGTYYATIAYTVNGQKVSNYLGLSNPVGLFTHENLQGSLELSLSSLDESYDEYELVIVSITGNQQTVAKRIGLYSTLQKKVFLDIIPDTLVSVPLEFLPVHNALADSSDVITSLGDNLLRIGPKSKFDFNYQPRANKIELKWVSVEYPANYHRDGGPNTNHMRDENMAAFIRWVYEDGDRSSSFHIPGRAPLSGETASISSIYTDSKFFERFNTASQTSITVVDLGDGGFQVAEGKMGYHETEELYPIDKPEIWEHLCGKKIRHHKFPDRSLSNRTNIYSDKGFSPIIGPVIRVMGFKAYNITPPVDNQGKIIPGIVGYELLRGSREGNKTVIAKGIVNNVFTYNLETTDINEDKTRNPNNVVRKKGAYPNYPYNALQNDPFIVSQKGQNDRVTGVLAPLSLNKGWYNKNPGAPQPTEFDPPFTEASGTFNNNFDRSLLTFHSPDTTFRRPFLSATELKTDGIISGNPVLKFFEPEEHPRHKLPTNFAFFIAALSGLALAVLKMIGPRGSTSGIPSVGGISGATAIGVALVTSSVLGALLSKRSNMETIDSNFNNFGGVVSARDTNIEHQEAIDRNNATKQNVVQAQISQGAPRNSFSGGGTNNALGILFRSVGGISLFSQQWSEGINTVYDLIMSFSEWQQYALQQISHCFYNHYGSVENGSNPTPDRFLIKTAKYLDPVIQDFDEDIRINNLYRARTVALRTKFNNVENPTDFDAKLEDTSKASLKCWPNPFVAFEEPTLHFWIRTASSYYASLKVRLRNQYGQIGDVKQIPISCVNHVTINEIAPERSIFNSPITFGGDTYITRYTEKNTMFFFYDWLYKQFDGEEYDYFKSRMHQFPAYWMITKKIDMGDFIRGLTDTLGGSITSLANSNSNTAPNANIENTPWLPSHLVSMDRPPGVMNVHGNMIGFVQQPGFKNSLFILKGAYFYLFVSGVRDFYVESEINLGYRDWEEPVEKRHFDEETYTDLVGMFSSKPDIIKAGNYYKYDYSLSVSRSFVNMASWGVVQPSYYDPQIAETCYVYNDKRVLYSLPHQAERVRDAWRVFLANNYRDFRSKITTIKSIGDNGAVILFERDIPLQMQGTETLETTRGTKITIGDGELLQQTKQNLTNADRMYQYGACQSLRSVVNTPMGLFWISQAQGKIFTVGGNGLLDIVMKDMHDWFATYLPYQLLKQFSNFDLIDNPVSGIGCQAVYDNRNEIIYFTKKDYRFKTEVFGEATFLRCTYNSTTKKFYIAPVGRNPPPTGDDFVESNGILSISLDNPEFFENVSWTMSYDIKRKSWISWHDWHPDLVMPSQSTFYTIKKTGIFQHNNRCDLFCHYYDVDHPFEIEYSFNTNLSENTLMSIEYYMEIFKWSPNCRDKYMFHEDNFDEAIVYNHEQISGLLKLVNAPFNDPFSEIEYPKFNSSSVEVLYSKVENKFRINQLVDLTDNRGMFVGAQRALFLTSANGYTREFNQFNLNYNKDVLEHKFFRGYMGNVFFRKKVCRDKNFVFLFAVNKLLDSKR